MPNEPPDQSEVFALREVVEGFIKERLKPKLDDVDKKIEQETDFDKKQELLSKRQQLLTDYSREPWLENAAKRGGQIQLATHALKYIHPDARGSSLYVDTPNPTIETNFVGTSSLGSDRRDDVVGNAAALDVYKFLQLKHKEQTILGRIRANDPALSEALSIDSSKAAEWIKGFAKITGGELQPSSHKMAKQIYFPLQEGGYHLLAPLFPTSLVHSVHTHLREERFSEKTKEARQARREGKYFSHGYHEYPNIVVQVFGGSQPQNISQLNSERYGENWLLPSFPPNWRSNKVRPPITVNSVFRRWFGGRPVVRELIKSLSRFLATTHYNNISIRRTRAELVDRLCDELLQFAAELTELAPGWSASPECRLDQIESLWLDPDRSLTDDAFATEHRKGDWQEEVASRFSNWLNHQLTYHASLPMGENEYAEWKGVIEKALNMIKREIAHD